MNTENRTLRIRRATPLDAVNLYRLLVSEEKRTGAGRPFDEAARMAHIIVAIAEGFVTVAVISGRIVGSIGAIPTSATYIKGAALTGEWFVILPSFSDTKVGAKLVQGLVRFADLHQLGIEFTLRYPLASAMTKVVEENGCVAVAQMYIREAKHDDEPAGDPDEPSERSGSDPG
jgi:hypothetical protein